jgi:hypothetical protein
MVYEDVLTLCADGDALKDFIISSCAMRRHCV